MSVGVGSPETTYNLLIDTGAYNYTIRWLFIYTTKSRQF